jgi:hypothetical protein
MRRNGGNMDKLNNNRGTPSKDTGTKNNNFHYNTDFKNSPEITTPNPSTATTSTPDEIPIIGNNYFSKD